jgi:hypothetical protein
MLKKRKRNYRVFQKGWRGAGKGKLSTRAPGKVACSKKKKKKFFPRF